MTQVRFNAAYPTQVRHFGSPLLSRPRMTVKRLEHRRPTASRWRIVTRSVSMTDGFPGVGTRECAVGAEEPGYSPAKNAAGLGPAFAVLTPEVAGLCKHPGA
jgi:hypothetical protein